MIHIKLEELAEYEEEVIALRRWFHQRPEPSLREVRTSQKMKEHLTESGISWESVGETGVLGTIVGTGPGQGTILALRADMDALEITEATGLSFASQTPGMMHACGHDAHIAALLVAGKWLQSHRAAFPHTVKLIFQPGEEIGAGAEEFITEGKLSGVTAVFGLHIDPMHPVGTIGYSTGPVMAGAGGLNLRLVGKSGHAGLPETAVDAVVAGAALVTALQSIRSRELSPTSAGVVSIGSFHAGTRGNILAGEAKLQGTFRAESEPEAQEIIDAIQRITAGISAAYRVTPELTCGLGVPPIVNAPELESHVVAAYQSISPGGVPAPAPFRAMCDNFSIFSRIAPIAYAFVGVRPEVPEPQNVHHEAFLLHEDGLLVSAALHIGFILSFS